MDITAAVDGAQATIAVAGTIDTRASADFEGELRKAVEAGARRVILDLSRVDLITSAGIRVLVMMAKRLQGLGGGLVLCAMSADVHRVFDISGLTSQFRIVASAKDAAALLAQPERAPRKGADARISQAVKVLLGGRSKPAPGGAAAAGQEGRSPLSTHVIGLLTDKIRQPRK